MKRGVNSVYRNIMTYVVMLGPDLLRVCFTFPVSCFNVVSVADFLSHSICFVPIAAMCSSISQEQKPRISAAEDSILPQLRQSRCTTQPQPVESKHTD